MPTQVIIADSGQLFACGCCGNILCEDANGNTHTHPATMTMKIIGANLVNPPGGGFDNQGFWLSPQFYVGLSAAMSGETLPLGECSDELTVLRWSLFKWRTDTNENMGECADFFQENQDGDCTEAEFSSCFETHSEAWKQRTRNATTQEIAWIDGARFQLLPRLVPGGGPCESSATYIDIDLGLRNAYRIPPPGIDDPGLVRFCTAGDVLNLQSPNIYTQDEYVLPPPNPCETAYEQYRGIYKVYAAHNYPNNWLEVEVG